MQAPRHIADLDRALANAGQMVTLRRGTATPFTDLAVQASVRAQAADEAAGGMTAADFKVVISPSGLDNAAWMAAANAETPAAPFSIDRRLPRRGDAIIIAGRRHAIEAVKAVHVRDVLVRIEMQARS